VINKNNILNLKKWYERRWRWLNFIDRIHTFKSIDEPLIGKDLVDRIAKHVGADNDKIAKNLNLPLAKYGYPMESN
jgi:hypothetical protein